MNRSSRRDFIRIGLGAALLPRGADLRALAESHAEPPTPGVSTLVLDAPLALPELPAEFLRMGSARHPDGRQLLVNSHSLVLDERPWLPVMGEFHYARYPESEWREELLKMKAGGIDIAATYIFWIHHEEVEGTFDWSGRRSLHRFVELCSEAGLRVVLRCGPWCHGEVRNGGLPDWILGKGLRLRSNDPGYLDCARRLYGEIARQVDGLLWKDGGPVVGIQCENEYSGPAEHLLTLKRIARGVGLDVPFYTRTGWPPIEPDIPAGDILPLYGAYAAGFWDRELTSMPGGYDRAFLFELARTGVVIASDQAGRREQGDGHGSGPHPYFCCEIGGGMERSYHRRIRIAPADTESVALVKLGCGNNLQGYYMFHGGTNPEGRLTTLQESQATGFLNDVPVKSYDYQAPLGEFGQIRRHYHLLRRLHLFLRDYGPFVATLPARLPVIRPTSATDTSTLRWSVRTDGRSGLLFVNNYHRLRPMPAKSGVQFEIRLPGGVLRLPDEPFVVPENSVFFWLFDHVLAGARLVYATAQPVCHVEDRGSTYAVFAATPGVPAEFVFDPKGVVVEHTTGQATSDATGLRVRRVAPGTGAAIQLRTATGARLCVILLDLEDSLACWKAELMGHERLFLTRAGLVIDGGRLRLTASDPSDLAVSILPAPASLVVDGSRRTGAPDGLFRRFAAPARRVVPVSVSPEPLRPAGPPRTIRMGSGGVAEAPADAEFVEAAVWRLRLPHAIDPHRDLLLRLRYVGDVARLYLDQRLLIDDFYNGNPFEIGLRRHAPAIYKGELLLKILPLQKGAPIYLSRDAWPEFGNATSVARLDGVDVVEPHHARFTAV
jgi:hypothetical protein